MVNYKNKYLKYKLKFKKLKIDFLIKNKLMGGSNYYPINVIGTDVVSIHESKLQIIKLDEFQFNEFKSSSALHIFINIDTEVSPVKGVTFEFIDTDDDDEEYEIFVFYKNNYMTTSVKNENISLAQDKHNLPEPDTLDSMEVSSIVTEREPILQELLIDLNNFSYDIVTKIEKAIELNKIKETFSEIHIENELTKKNNIVWINSALEENIKTINFCEFETPQEDLGEFRILSRIGSDSAQGLVYHLLNSSNKEQLVMKVLPIFNDNEIVYDSIALSNNIEGSPAFNENEILIAKRLSQIVKSGLSNNFPLVFKDSYCEEVNYNNTKFNDISTSGHIMISEYIVGGDLKQFRRDFPGLFLNEQFNKILLLDILDCIRDLRYFGVVHGDLHLGNILVDYDPSKPLSQSIKCKIHDFGNSISFTNNIGKYTGVIPENDEYPTLLVKDLQNISKNLLLPHAEFYTNTLKLENLKQQLESYTLQNNTAAIIAIKSQINECVEPLFMTDDINQIIEQITKMCYEKKKNQNAVYEIIDEIVSKLL